MAENEKRKRRTRKFFLIKKNDLRSKMIRAKGMSGTDKIS